MENLVIKVVSFEEAIEPIQTIRRLVFQEEQGVDLALDFDGLDDSTPHIIVYCAGLPVGTARIRKLSDQTAKLERMAVLPAYRGQGIGRELVRASLNFATRQNISEIRLHAQIHAQKFYEKLGFAACGEVFDEAGIEHITMHQGIPDMIPNDPQLI